MSETSSTGPAPVQTDATQTVTNGVPGQVATDPSGPVGYADPNGGATESRFAGLAAAVPAEVHGLIHRFEAFVTGLLGEASNGTAVIQSTMATTAAGLQADVRALIAAIQTGQVTATSDSDNDSAPAGKALPGGSASSSTAGSGTSKSS